MIVAKIQKPFLTPLRFMPDQGFVWVSRVAYVSYTQPTEYSSDFDFSDVNQIALNITEVYIDGEGYFNASSEAICRATEKSFYFSAGTQEMFVHLEHTKRMESSVFSANQIISVTNDGVFYDENNFESLPYLKSGFSLSDSVERFVFGKMGLVSNTLTLDNRAVLDNTDPLSDSEHVFDYLIDSVVAGSDINILYISSEDVAAGKKTLTPLYTGYIIETNINEDDVSIRLEDKRGQLNVKLPTDTFTVATYANIEDKYIDKIIPVGYGDVNNAPAFCVNGTVKTGDVLYKYAADGTSLTTVQVNDNDVWTTVTPTASDATAGTFTLATGDGRDSNGNPLECRVIARLRDMDNPADIIVDMLFEYTGAKFDIASFDTVEWAEEAALLDDIFFYIDKKEEFFKHVEKLQGSTTLNFRFSVDGGGKYSLKVDDITRAITQEIPAIDVISDLNQIETDFTDYATSVQIEYNQDLSSEQYSQIIRDDYYDATFEKYRFNKELEFKTWLKTEALAIEKGQNTLKEYKTARPLITFEVDCINCGELLDVVTVDLAKYDGITKTRDYAGPRKLKISSKSMKFEQERTIFKGYDISDIVSKGTEVTIQGDLYGEFLHGNRLFGSSGTYIPEVG